MAKLDLPTGPAELLEAVRRPLGHHLSSDTVRGTRRGDRGFTWER